MSGAQRILAIMGSGETTPSMAPVHRALLARLGPPPIHATLLDTPYGFQENAAEITAAAIDYFETRLRNPVSVASFRRSGGDRLERQAALARLRDADYVFSGPGSPSYALRQWEGTEVPALLADKLMNGGALVTASAAALTLGRVTVPVYEIYKVGDDPHWLPGLDLLSSFGLPVAVIPHYDNAEGRGHDTRFCFLGEQRLRRLEREMPRDTFILGVDEHTSLIIDLASGELTIGGRGGVTVRREGRSVVFAAGTELTVDDVLTAAFGSRRTPGSRLPSGETARDPDTNDAARAPVRELERRFASAADGLDIAEAVRALLALEDLSSATGAARNGGTIDVQTSRRSMLLRLADAAVTIEGRAELVDRLTDALLAIRRTARDDRDWAAADAIRDTLQSIGVELHDSDAGTTWSLPGARRR